MSYCRWGSDDFRCDLYCYQGTEWVIHVAGNRLPPEIEAKFPPLIPFSVENVSTWHQRHQIIMKIIEGVEYVPIGLPYDGKTFEMDSPAGCADKIEELRALGYRCPDGVVEALRDEQKELDALEIIPPAIPADAAGEGEIK